jgi:predicted RNase H-like nuclease
MIERFLGVDLAWADSPARIPNESGVVALNRAGEVLAAGWTRGLDETIEWIAAFGGRCALLFVDAPLVIDNPAGQRLCDTQVGQRYGRWKVSANTVNLNSPHQAGVRLLARLRVGGWTYGDGRDGPPTHGPVISECYPYTTLVGAPEFGCDVERPRYKRKPTAMGATQWRSRRATACDELIVGMNGLRDADPALLLDSHAVTRRLLAQASPETDKDYKHREDLVDAVLCAWTAALWDRHGFARCQVLGLPAPANSEAVATIIAPARGEQRR